MSNEIRENLCIKPICNLLGEDFFIPRYQRGYRWGKQEITELLNDLKDYSTLVCNRENKISKFYCLQPIVVKEKSWVNSNNNSKQGWEVIDGQQRLTTLFLILNFLEPLRKNISFKHIPNKEQLYSLNFETREDSEIFFKNKKFVDGVRVENVDYYHISKAYEIISDWFEVNGANYEILNVLLKESYNVSVIWYEAIDEKSAEDKEKASIELFTRLNEGKIPLTDAELIKALLLQSDLYPKDNIKYIKQRLFEIASEWDIIEANLQDEKMWLFINDFESTPSSRIELIFKMLAEKWNGYQNEALISYVDEDGKRVKPKHFEFMVFDKYLSNQRLANCDEDILMPINTVWEEVKEIYNTLYDWYQDHTLYHYIGYLLANEKSKTKLIYELIGSETDKDIFLNNIKKRVAEKVKIVKLDKDTNQPIELSSLVYGSDNSSIISILLLFNVETLVKHDRENARFPFHLYKSEKITSIEHIHPQNPEEIVTDESRALEWINSHQQSFNDLMTKLDSSILDKINFNLNSLKVKFNKELFAATYSEVIKFYSEIADFKENEEHTLYNLALVDKDTNSSLNNSFFDIKRNLLKENRLERYIPVCTERAFAKYYSKNPKEMIFWSNEDRKAYFTEIESVYNSFIKLLN